MTSTEKQTAKQGTLRRISTIYLVMTALFTALTFVVTFFLNVPATIILGATGNINLGDSIIIIAGIVLGPLGGAIAGGIGAAMADVASSYIVYAPFTLVIKAFEGFMCGMLYRKIFSSQCENTKKAITVFSPTILLMIGYFLAEVIILLIIGNDSEVALIVVALRTLIPNFMQGVICGFIAYVALPKIPKIESLL